MNDAPLVSILIPAFNSERWLAETLESAVAQTWRNIEIIVVDDGSADGTFDVAKQFAGCGVRVVRQQNRGAAAARNTAFQLSSGDYIQWLDADDVLAPDKIERQVQERAPHRTLLSSSWAWFLYRRERAEFVPTALWCDLSPVDWLLRKLDWNLHMQTATWLVSRELTEAAGPWDTTLLVDDDGEYFCRVLLASGGVRFVRDARVYYRASGCNSLSYIGATEGKVRSHWRSMLAHIAYLHSLEDSDRVRRACLRYLQNWLIQFYPEHGDIVRQAENLAAELGGTLRPPEMSWKYSWITSTLGWQAAKRVQRTARAARWTMQRSWDRTLYRIERATKTPSNSTVT